MVICHIAVFAPGRCGLYEAARDMAKADAKAGHSVIFIDAGVSSNGVQETPVIGGVDDRVGFKLVTGEVSQINDADIIFMHTGCPDNWIVTNQAPIIWVVHGRPEACFIPNNASSYNLYKDVSKWKRSKHMLYFWPEFKAHWDFGNDLILDYPIIDQERFCPEGEKYQIKNLGQKNILICDSDREDVGLYNLVIGLIETSKQIKGLKFHFVGLEGTKYQPLLNRLNEFGSLGDVIPRLTNIETVYRSMDCLISPNRIVVRTIAEALSCGIRVIAQNGCKVSDICVDINDPIDVVKGFELLLEQTGYIDRAHLFSMKSYGVKMNAVYKEMI